MNETFKQTTDDLLRSLYDYSEELAIELNEGIENDAMRDAVMRLKQQVGEDIIFVEALQEANAAGMLRSVSDILAARVYSVKRRETEIYIPVRKQMLLRGESDIHALIKELNTRVSSGRWADSINVIASLPHSKVEAVKDVANYSAVYAKVKYTADKGRDYDIIIGSFGELLVYCTLFETAPITFNTWRYVATVRTFRECLSYGTDLARRDVQEYSRYVDAHDAALIPLMSKLIERMSVQNSAIVSTLSTLNSDLHDQKSSTSTEDVYTKSEIDAKFTQQARQSTDKVIIAFLCVIIIITVIHLFIH